MIEYLKKIIDSSQPESSKRFISVLSFFLFIIVVVSALFGIIVPDVYIYSLVSLILGSSAMTLAQNNNKTTNNNENK